MLEDMGKRSLVLPPSNSRRTRCSTGLWTEWRSNLADRKMNIFSRHVKLTTNDLQAEQGVFLIRKKRAPVSCESINPPKNGQSSGQCVPGYPGRVCRFNCIPGYRRLGESAISCGQDGIWSSSPAKCVPAQ